MRIRPFVLAVTFAAATSINSAARADAIAAYQFLTAAYAVAKKFQDHNGARFVAWSAGAPMYYANFTNEQVSFIANTAHCGPWNEIVAPRTQEYQIQCDSGHGDRVYSVKFNGSESFIKAPGAIAFQYGANGAVELVEYDLSKPPTPPR